MPRRCKAVTTIFRLVHAIVRRNLLWCVRSSRPHKETAMKRSLSALSAAPIFASAALTAFACSGDPNSDADSEIAEQTSAVHNFCGNRRCDHGETCSTCSLDCGQCSTGG